MIIRKQFKGEMSHVVRNCSTERCSYSIHGHSFLVEVFLWAEEPDNAGMVMDFGLMKRSIGSFIDSFDHCHVLWDKDLSEMRKFIKDHNLRWIEIPVNPSAENLAALMFYYIDEILKATEFNNGENEVTVEAVRYHETSTGYAEARVCDVLSWLPENKNIEVSTGIYQDWPAELQEFMTSKNNAIFFKNPVIDLQVK